MVAQVAQAAAREVAARTAAGLAVVAKTEEVKGVAATVGTAVGTAMEAKAAVATVA